MSKAVRFTSTEDPRYCVEGRTHDPRTAQGSGGDCVTDYQPVQAKGEAERLAREYHRRGLWVEIYSQVTKELLAGPFDPDEPMPSYVIGG
ncbi:hypothetical protein QTH90_30795 [Variovorax sp. J2P1-59]|uniref:hypothetical protein n=1 Tax=Variovorax flavidus TaxID=3053501 RepID=UPI002575CB25|nr:hypothetical protein [Variovorax sp. J2P1-59]MDM0078830.1 hypothetical protein [Variovorax sp. J2P1-59]